MIESLGEHVFVEVPVQSLNINNSNTATAAGGTAAANHWTAMKNHGKLTAFVNFDSRDAGAITQILVQQAQDAAGTGLKAVANGQYDIANTVLNATGKNAIVEVDAAQMDVSNGYEYLRVLVTHTTAGTTNKVTVVYLKFRVRFGKAAWDNYTIRLPQAQAGT